MEKYQSSLNKDKIDIIDEDILSYFQDLFINILKNYLYGNII